MRQNYNVFFERIGKRLVSHFWFSVSVNSMEGALQGLVPVLPLGSLGLAAPELEISGGKFLFQTE